MRIESIKVIANRRCRIPIVSISFYAAGNSITNSSAWMVLLGANAALMFVMILWTIAKPNPSHCRGAKSTAETSAQNPWLNSASIV
jgi:hypothetical protein